MKHIVEQTEIKKISDLLHRQKKSLVVAGGCFDLLHIGHIHLLENAKKEGDILIVLLESDSSIKKMKGIDRPIHTQKERAHLLTALRAVDIVVLLPDEMTNDRYDSLLQEIKPAIIATTQYDPNRNHKKRQADAIGAKVIAVNKYIPSVSTTKLLHILSKES